MRTDRVQFSPIASNGALLIRLLVCFLFCSKRRTNKLTGRPTDRWTANPPGMMRNGPNLEIYERNRERKKDWDTIIVSHTTTGKHDEKFFRVNWH